MAMGFFSFFFCPQEGVMYILYRNYEINVGYACVGLTWEIRRSRDGEARMRMISLNLIISHHRTCRYVTLTMGLYENCKGEREMM